MSKISKAKSLLQRLHNMQVAIYDFSSALDDLSSESKSEGVKRVCAQASELATESGFELDVAQQKMEDCLTLLKNAFGRTNYTKRKIIIQ